MLEETARCLAPFGRLVVYGAASGITGALPLEPWLYAPALNQSITGFNLGAFFGLRPEIAGGALAELTEDVARGKIRAPEVHVWPLAKAQEAHDRLGARATTGKLVLQP